MVLYLTLGICAGLAGLLVYRYDLYDREPWPLLLAVAAAGAAAMEGAGRLEDRLILLPGPFPADPWVAFVAAAMEETARLLLVVAVAFLARRWFNDPMDGLVYGSVAGLGMAVRESVDALARDPPGGLLLPAPELVRLCAHLVLGGIAGFAVGMIRTRIPGGPPALAACMSAAVGMHFLVDWITLAAPGSPLSAGRTAAAAATMLAGIGLYGTLVALGSEWSRRRFAPAARGSLLRWPFTLLRRPRDRGAPPTGGTG